MIDSYFACLLYKGNKEEFKYIIQGLNSFFALAGMKSKKVYPLLGDFMKDTQEKAITYQDYLNDLLWGCVEEPNAGLAFYTSSLMSVILYEKEILNPNIPVRVLTSKTNYMQYSKVEINYKDKTNKS